jgi:hypothetical protein
MKIPDGPNGYPTVSATQLRTYGAGGFRLAEHEDARGCPRQYRAKYVDHTVPENLPTPYELAYGSMFHEVLFVMEEQESTPKEALDTAFRNYPNLTPEAYEEAWADLTGYLERGASPTDRFGTLSVENELTALLYVDEEFGPVYYRGMLDWLGIDLDDPTVIHFVDYKTNRMPPSDEDVLGDVQLKGYHWLLRECLEEVVGPGTLPRTIVTHLDAVKWREVPVQYDEQDIDAWHAWAVAVTAAILRDEEAEPILNPGCAFCPVRGDCPAFESLPDVARTLLELKPASDANDDARLVWRDQANATRLLLEKAVKEIDGQYKERTLAQGEVITTGWTFRLEPDFQDRLDMRVLHRALGDEAFYRVASSSKAAVWREVEEWPPSDLAAVQAAWDRVPVGTKVSKKKRPS